MNILITGATGFVGTNLLKHLKKKYAVHALVRPDTDLTKVDTALICVFDDNVPSLTCYLAENKIEGIIHLASLYIAQHQPDQIKPLTLSNIYLGTALLEAAVQSNVKWFLNTGTIWQNFIPDSKEYCPVNLYAATKQAFIDIAEYYIQVSNLKFCTLKLCDTYGSGDTRKKVLALFKQIAETGESLDMSPGEQFIDLVHIDDVVKGFILLAEMLTGDVKVEKEYVLSSGKIIRLKDLADLYQQMSGKTLPINWGKRKYREREVMIPWREGIVLPGWEPNSKLIII